MTTIGHRRLRTLAVWAIQLPSQVTNSPSAIPYYTPSHTPSPTPSHPHISPHFSAIHNKSNKNNTTENKFTVGSETSLSRSQIIHTPPVTHVKLTITPLYASAASPLPPSTTTTTAATEAETGAEAASFSSAGVQQKMLIFEVGALPYLIGPVDVVRDVTWRDIPFGAPSKCPFWHTLWHNTSSDTPPYTLSNIPSDTLSTTTSHPLKQTTISPHFRMRCSLNPLACLQNLCETYVGCFATSTAPVLQVTWLLLYSVPPSDTLSWVTFGFPSIIQKKCSKKVIHRILHSTLSTYPLDIVVCP